MVQRVSSLVLYVDDDRSSRIVFEQSFGRDFEVMTAPDARAALALLESHEVAVLLTDVQMPGLSGEELLRIARERHPRAIRIVVTAYSDVDRILRALNEGLVARYIIKPWERAELAQVLRWGCEAWGLAETGALRQRLAETDRVAATIHDLKTPLTAILANAEHLELLAASAPALRAALAVVPLAPERRRELSLILDELGPIAGDVTTAGRQIHRLVDQLLPTATVGPLIDPLPIVRHALAVCEPIAAQLSASLRYEGPGALPHVRVSPQDLTQVLINVLSNGAQAVAARGGAGAVSIAAHEREGMLELQVHDDGVGIAEEAVGRVGTPFYTTRDDGAGLGVARCKRLLATAGGAFEIASEPGAGTTVTILLPAVHRAA